MNENDLSRSTFTAYKRLSPDQQAQFAHDLECYRKDVRVGYLWWFALGSHRAYLGQWPLQLLFWITLGGVFVWWVVDAFNMEKMVLAYNHDVSERIMRGLKEG